MSVGHSANADDKLTVYSYRQTFLVEPILTRFTEETGIGVNLVFAKDGIAERLAREGHLSPADLVLTSDFSRLVELVDKDLTSPVKNAQLESNIPAQYRDPDGQWYALTMRVRNLYTAKDRLGPQQITYEELADPKWKGKICARSGQHTYNIALIASMIAHHGETEAEKWLAGLRDNLARKPAGGDREGARDVHAGLCDLAIGNTYYMAAMMKREETKPHAEAVKVLFPNAADRGTHVNVSGGALAAHAPNRDNAVKLVEFFLSRKSQESYVGKSGEYPVIEGAEPSEIVRSWGELKPDSLSIAEIAAHRKKASELVDKVRFDAGPAS